MSNTSQILVVGAGITGAVIAQQLAEHNFAVQVIDKRDHIAGNAFDFVNEHGIRIHRYGPHIFHTNNTQVVDYLSRFTEWLPYQHKVKALLADGQYVTFPPNRETSKIIGAENILNILYRPYTRKMWAMELDDLNPKIVKRVPVRDDLCELYFPNDQFQALPKNGYTKMVANILNHPNIKIALTTPFNKSMESDYEHIFNCMPIDEYYDFCFGELSYRSIKFIHEYHDAALMQPAAVINFTTQKGATRCTEWRHFPGHCNQTTAIGTNLTSEFPCDYRDNEFERYYPVADAAGKNRKNYKKYAALPNKKITFTGRCGNYVYIDMHQAVNIALHLSSRFANTHILK